MEIELSLLGTPSRHTDVQSLVKAYERRTSAHVKVAYHTWDTAWSNIMRSRSQGPALAVSEAGTSWVPGLAGMDALVPVPADMINKVGNEKDYVPQAWKSCFLFGSQKMWAVPWLTGARVIYYRKDLLDRAHVNPDTAFATPQSMLEAVARLKAAGIARPWITSNSSSLNTLHLISSWIWASGSDYISADGRHLLFASPQAIEGMANFFRLGQYMGSAGKEVSYDDAIDLFWRGDAAITMDGTWMYEAQRATAEMDVLDHLGVALPPGPSFVGGSDLVVWANKIDAAPAWDLLLFMTEPDSVLAMFKLTGLAPARLSLLNSRDVLKRAFGPTLNRAMETGRSLPNHRFSGMVEDNLHYAFGLVWADLLKTPQADPRELLTRQLILLKERLELAMNS